MMKREDIEKLTLQLLKKNNKKGWSVSFNDFSWFYAECDPSKKQIRYSELYRKHLPKKILLNIIIHEVAHAVVGTKHSHNKIWQKKCIELGGTGQCVEYPIEEFELKIREMYGNYETYCSKCKTKQYWWGKSGKRECCGKPLKEIKR